MVGAGKDRSGFHGTTIQAVYSKPSEKKLQVELVLAGFEDTSAVAIIINTDAKIVSAPGSNLENPLKDQCHHTCQ